MPKKDRPARQFLIIKFFGLGSLARIVHVLEQDSDIKSRVRFLTLKKNQPLMEELNLEATFVNDKNIFRFFGSTVCQVLSIWRSQSITVLNMERSSNLAGLFGMIAAIGKPYRGFHFKPKNKSIAGQKWINLVNQTATNAIAEMLEISINPTRPQQKSTRKTIEVIALNINAGDYLPERKFPFDKWVELCRELSTYFPNATLVLTGLSNEKIYVDQLEQKLKSETPGIRINNLAGKQNISQFLDFLKSIDLFITNDSGPLHFANLKGVKTVAIWGPTLAKQVGYSDSEMMLNLQLEKSCSPCFIHPKSCVAKACNGQLSCFQEMDTFDMVRRIHKFAGQQL